MRSVLNEDNVFDVYYDTFKQIGSKLDEKRSKNDNYTQRKNYYLGGSIARYTKGLVMSFPVLFDDSLSLETSQIISKANEKNIASMLEMLFASMSINGKNGMTGKDVINIFHKNIDTMSMDDIIDYSNSYVNNFNLSENVNIHTVTEAEIRDYARDMVADLKTGKKVFPVSSFKETSLNDYMTRDTFNGIIVYEHKQKVVNEAQPSQLDYDKFEYQKQQDEKKFEYQRQQDEKKFGYQQQRDNLRDRQYNNDRNDAFNRTDISLNQRRILDSDFKKANELQPTMMIVNFNVLDNHEIVDRKSFVAGVKCRLIATTAIDIVERLIASNKTKLSFKNLIRANTGEIKLGRDFLFAIDQQKLSAKNDVKKGEAARLWSTIKKRSNNNSYRKAMRDGNDASAITTLVVSQDTVNYMKTTDAKFDLLNPKNAKFIMDQYNLLCLIIADEANEVAHFMYDGNSYFEDLAYSVLSKEAQDKSYRKVVNLINQAGR